MFGANTGGGLFGGGANTGGGLFGGAQSGGGMFGANSGGGLFGGANTGGGLFGGGASASGGGLFGGANTGGGLFGGANAGGGLGGQQAGGGLFGQPGGQQAGGGMFGQPAAAVSDPNAMEQNFKQIGEQFAQTYYQTFASNRQGLAQFYEAQSCYTLDAQPPQPPTMVQGQQQIVQQLSNLPIQHQPASCHAQPVPGSPDKVLVLVRGKIQVNGQQINFVEVFQLMKKPTGNWFILNDTFQVVPP